MKKHVKHKIFGAEIIYSFSCPMEYQDSFVIKPINDPRHETSNLDANMLKYDRFLAKVFDAIEEANKNLQHLPIVPSDIVNWTYKGDFPATFYLNICSDKKCFAKRDGANVTWKTFRTETAEFLSTVCVSS